MKASLVVVLAFAAVALALPSDSCMKKCPKIYMPVCGSNGSGYKIFSNRCLMEQESCLDSMNWFVVDMNICENVNTRQADHCMRPCPYIYMPVCGFNGYSYTEFPNKCVMEQQHCVDSFEWLQVDMTMCHKPEPRSVDDCMKPCPRNYNPVCAFNGDEYKEFANECVMEQEHCLDSHEWFKVEMNMCKKSTPCERPCPKNLLPVCGFDGENYKVFPNQCLMDNEHCLDSHSWFQVDMNMCEKPKSADNCVRACPRNYLPVCGFNGEHFKEFPNECVMENEHCLDSHVWFKVEMNMCKKSTPCERPCPKNLLPVCGFDGENYKVFPNQCLMDNEHCLDSHSWFQVDMNMCEKPKSADNCVRACPRNYLPVCGFNGEHFKEFPNECVMENEHCLDSHEWFQVDMNMCKKPEGRQMDCARPCPKNYIPVCGFDGEHFKEFPNECVMENEHCLDSHEWFKVDMNMCKKTKSDNFVRPCPLNYAPVCGFNGVNYEIFGNLCGFEAANLHNNYLWQQTSLDECEANGLYAYP